MIIPLFTREMINRNDSNHFAGNMHNFNSEYGRIVSFRRKGYKIREYFPFADDKSRKKFELSLEYVTIRDSFSKKIETEELFSFSYDDSSGLKINKIKIDEFIDSYEVDTAK